MQDVTLSKQNLVHKPTLLKITASFVFLSCLSLRPSFAEDLNDLLKAAVLSDALTAAESQQFQAITRNISSLAGLDITNANIAGGTITGEVKFLNQQWDLLAFTNGDADNTFVTFGPKKDLRFKDLFQNVPGIDLLDVIRFEQQMLAFAPQDIALKSNDLPETVRKSMGRFYDTPQYNLSIPTGLTQLGTINLKDVGVLNKAVEFLGGESGTVQARVALKGDDVLGDLLKGKPPVPHIKLTAPMPAFRPSIGGKLTLPADMNMTLVGELEGKQANLTYVGITTFDISGKPVNMNLDTGITLRAGAPEFAVTASTLKGEPVTGAFGVNWLTIEDYRMTFGQEADALKMGFGGKTTFGEKQFDVFALGAVSAKTLGVPIPETIQLSINDGPDKVGALSLRDIASIFVAMLKANGQNVTLPDAFPDLAITGTEKGKGPSLNLVLKTAGNAGIDISGALRLLDTEIATVERAFVQVDTGIEIKARTADLAVGPIKFPTADVDVSLKADGLNLTEPRAIIRAKALSLFGSDNGFDLIVRPTYFELKALSDFGSLFKFNVLATTEGPIKSMKHLENADFQLAGALSSDPGKWIREEGRKVVDGTFGGVIKVLDHAQDALKSAQTEVATLDGKIKSMTAEVNASKDSGADSLQASSDELERLTVEIDKVQREIDLRNNAMQSCNQSTKQCVLSLPVQTGCLQDSFIGCVVPKMDLECKEYAEIPDVPAIAACVGTNTKLALELVALETSKGILTTSRSVAKASFDSLRDGVQSIPVELDPRISGLIIARESAMFTLKVSEEAVKGIGDSTRILTQGFDILASPDIFALENSTIQGSLRNAVNGKPVVLDMNFRMLGEQYQQRLAFSLTDMVFNAKQFEVIALGAVVNSVLKIGREARIIPHTLLDEVQGIYNLKRAEVDAALDQAIASNPHHIKKTKLTTLDQVIDDQYKVINEKYLMEMQREAKEFGVMTNKKWEAESKLK
jgi:hypothetical protein